MAEVQARTLGVMEMEQIEEQIKDAAKADLQHVEVADELGAGQTSDEDAWLHGKKLWFALFGLMMAQLVTSLGGQMISPAFAIIVSDFDAASSFGWVGSAFFMSQCPCMLLFGQLLSGFDGKKILLVSLLWFALGSIICGSAKNIDAVIVGRAFSGIGAAGGWVGVLALIAAMAPLQQRPRVMGIFGLINAVGSGVGPPLSGYFADSVTWRLCFYFTLPIIVLAITAIWFLVPAQKVLRPFGPRASEIIDGRYRLFSKYEPDRRSVIYRLLGVDWVGFCLISLAVICLQLAIQWGGSVHPWTSGTILGLVIGGFVGLTLLFLAWEWKAGESALMPLFLFDNRTQYGGCLLSLLTLYANLIGVIMLPYFFEIVFDQTALQAGYKIMPYLMGAIGFSLISGIITTATGWFWPWLIVGPILTIVSGALYYTIQTSASAGAFYGYQILFAAGVGFTQQQVYVCIQAASKQEDIHLRIAAVSFTELFGGALAPTISTTIFSNKLAKNIALYAPDAPASVLRNTSIVASLPAALQAAVRQAYIVSLHPIFLQLCAMGGLSLLATIALIKPINLKKVGEHPALH